ncbi:carboxypeptidase regulatory-like domain-containing protein [Paraflavitalea speifideaquila]|uniref:carboxypeptidase regulatory-like domain-containing protein n=1 Tax=Paraflavitalea speifideaquila TaxID=3076558 RepID=UPI0028EE057D|nr:carboxypeptidase regulatory-like domain-containing protein [Paraflavitalea speifideiaquila]
MKLINPRVTMWGVLLLLHLIMYATAYSQTNQATARGTVLNEADAPMPGVTVIIAKEKSAFKRSAQTDSKGTFEFKGLDASGTYTFTFSHVGYAEKVVSGKPDASGNITLEAKLEQSASNTAAEVVVVGYGKSTKRDVTGSVKSVKSTDFNRGIINSPEELLQGKVSGVNITSATGEPGGMQKLPYAALEA